MDLSTDQRFSRLRIKISTTRAVSGDFITPVDGEPRTYFDEGQMFSIGTTIFTVPTTVCVTLFDVGNATNIQHYKPVRLPVSTKIHYSDNFLSGTACYGIL